MQAKTHNRTPNREATQSSTGHGLDAMRSRAASTVLRALTAPEPEPEDVVPTGIWKTAGLARPGSAA